jgi:hypothetical protein
MDHTQSLMNDSTEHESDLSIKEWGATWGSPSEMIRQWMQRLRNGKQDSHNGSSRSDSKSE